MTSRKHNVDCQGQDGGLKGVRQIFLKYTSWPVLSVINCLKACVSLDCSLSDNLLSCV